VKKPTASEETRWEALINQDRSEIEGESYSTSESSITIDSEEFGRLALV